MLLAALAALPGTTTAVQATEPAGIAIGDYEGPVVDLLETHCWDCHNPDDPRGSIDLESYHRLADARPQLKLWSSVREQIETGAMPPASRGELDEATKSTILAWIDANEDFYRSGAIVDPGRTLLRRLNRNEYRYTMRDLLGVELDVATIFPIDGSGGAGFDNVADTLFIPPLLMEKYIEATDLALDEVLASDEARQRLMPYRPGEELDAPVALERNLQQLARRAFRRPVADDEVERLLAVGRRVLDRDGGFDEAMRMAATATLLSPHFLLRIEHDPEDASQPWRIGGFELASRLSYLFWVSMPDDELLQAAAEGRLSSDEEIHQQVERMLADPRSKRLARYFGGQWLHFDKVQTHVDPDRGRFQAFNDRLQEAFYQEAYLFVDHLLRDNGSLLDLIDASYTFANAALAEFYGLEGVEGDHMRRVELNDPNRGGVLTMGAVLSVTSLPRRTSPVLRGKWVLEEILGTPPPPAPPDAGELPADDRQFGDQSLRERLAMHRDRPACFNCHARLDPYGLALENFDAIGGWREEERGLQIDPSAELPDGRAFSGPAELKQMLLEERSRFGRTVVEKLLTYALNRPLEPVDEPTIAALMKCLEDNDFRTRPLLRQLVTSYPFLHRRLDPVLPDEA